MYSVVKTAPAQTLDNFPFNINHKVKSTGFQPVSFSDAASWGSGIAKEVRGRGIGRGSRIGWTSSPLRTA
jgi:hypothetical protein